MRSGYHRDRFGFCCFMMWYFLALNIPTSWYSPVLFLVSPILVPSLSAKYWDLVWSHLWLTEELAMSVCGRNVLCENDSLLNHGAKIQHSVLSIIRFYTFPAIRGHFYYEMFACPWITLLHKAETCLYGFDTKEMEIRRLHILSKILMSDWV